MKTGLKTPPKKRPKSSTLANPRSLECIVPGTPADCFAGLPGLRYYSTDHNFQTAKPLSNKRVYIVLHFLTNILGFTRALMEFGLDPSMTTFFFKPYHYPHKEQIKELLTNWGFTIKSGEDSFKVEHQKQFILSAELETRRKPLPIVVIEDGGYITPLVLDSLVLSKCMVGTVEQTTRGMRKIEKSIDGGGKQQKHATFPILSLPDSKLKQKFEAPLIASAVVQSIINLLGGLTLKHMKVAIIGCGTIGCELIREFSKNDVVVTSFDNDAGNRLCASNLTTRVTNVVKDAVQNADIVIGCTGVSGRSN